MTRIGLLFMTIGLASVGCLPGYVAQEKQKPPAVRMQEQSPPPPTVNADGITEKNATEKARHLREEMEYEAKRQKAGPRPAPAKEKD